MLEGCLSCCRGPSKHKAVPKRFRACPGLDAASSLAIDTWQYQLVAHGLDSPPKNSSIKKSKTQQENHGTIFVQGAFVEENDTAWSQVLFTCLPLSLVLAPLLGPPVALAGWVTRLGVTSVMVVHQPCPKSRITPRSKCNVFSLLLRCADVITSCYIICCRARLNFSAASVLSGRGIPYFRFSTMFCFWGKEVLRLVLCHVLCHSLCFPGSPLSCDACVALKHFWSWRSYSVLWTSVLSESVRFGMLLCWFLRNAFASVVPGTFSVCISADHTFRQVYVQEKSKRCSVAMRCLCLYILILNLSFLWFSFLPLSWISKCGLQAYGAKA